MSIDPATDPSALDAAALRDLLDLLGEDREALADVVNAFVEEAPVRLGELRSGLAAGDSVLVGRAAHTLKANAATFGARELEFRSRALEEAARGGDLTDGKDLVDAVESSWRDVLPLLTHLRDHPGAAS